MTFQSAVSFYLQENSHKKDTTDYSELSPVMILHRVKRRKNMNFEQAFRELAKKDATGEYIVYAGDQWDQFDFDKALDILIEIDKRGEYIQYAGRDWKEFDYEKGLDALIKRDKTGRWILWAGREWKKLDYEKALDALIKRDKDGQVIYEAGLYWRQFDYDKGFAHLKKISPKFYRKAKNEWPLTGKEALDKTSRKLKKAPHRKDKILKLEATEINYENLRVGELYQKGIRKTDPNFDFDKGLDALIKKDKVGGYIYHAGCLWEEFDFDKGFDALFDIDKTGEYIYYAGMDWKEFDYKKAFAHLKKISPNEWYKKAKANWPPTGKQALDKTTDELKKVPHRKDKKLKLEDTEINYENLSAKQIYEKGKTDTNFDFKKGLDALLKNDKEGEYVYLAGKNWKEFDFEKGQNYFKPFDFTNKSKALFHAGRDWKQFDYKKGLYTLGLFARRNKGYFIVRACEEWKEVDANKAFDILVSLALSYEEDQREYFERIYEILFLYNRNIDYKRAKRILAKEFSEVDDDVLDDIFKEFPLTGKEALDRTADELKKAPHRKDKKLKLEDTEIDYKKLRVGELYGKGIGGADSSFDFNKGLDVLIKKDEVGGYIYNAGVFWDIFDYKKGFDALIKKDTTGEWIFHAGRDWKEFDYKKGLDALLSVDKTGEWLKKAKKSWPLTGKEALDKVSDELKKAPHRKDKKLKLEATEISYENLRVVELYQKGIRKTDPNFDFDKGLDALIKKDKVGGFIYHAGCLWKKFDFKRGLDALIQVDKTGGYIYYAGRDWKEFDFEKALEALIQKDKTGERIFWAGRYWKEFDYKKGADALLNRDKTGGYIYNAGIKWNQFDFKEGFKKLKEVSSEYHKEAKRDWPISGKEALDKVSDELKKAPHRKDKKLKL